MKQYKKILIMFVATMLMATSAFAGGTVNIIKQLNGAVNNNVGTVASEVNATNGQCTVTVTPANGYYIESVTAEKTVSGDLAQSRRFRAPSMNNMLVVNGPDEGYDPSGETSWTFTMPAADYDVEVVANFQTRTSIANAIVTLAETSFDYDGQAKEPVVESVILDNTTLTQSTDYTFEYSNNVDAGTGTVTVTGQGIYTGTAMANFTINKAALNDLSIEIVGWTYEQYDEEINAPRVNGNEGKGAETVLYKAQGADDGTYTQTRPSDAGNYIVKVEVAGTGNYEAGSATCDFTIDKAYLTDDDVTVSITEWTYGDKPNAPSVEGAPADANVSYAYYTVVDDEEVELEEVPTDAGAYTIKATISSSKNFYGITVDDEFEIAQADFSEVEITAIADQTYTGDSIEPTITVFFNGNEVDESEYYVDYGEDNVDVGTVTVTLTSTEINFANGDEPVTVTFKIKPAEVEITAENQIVTYNGDIQYFDNYGGDEVEVLALYYASEADREADENQIEDVVNAGTYYVKLVSGDDNYTFEPVYATLLVEPKELDEDMLWTEGIGEFIYNGQQQTWKEGTYGLVDDDIEELGTLGEDVDFTVSYENNVNVGTATVTFTGEGNYQGTFSRTFQIVRQLNITFNETRQWASYYAEEDLEIPEGLKAYIVTGIGDTEVKVGVIDYIPQHQGVLLTYEEGYLEYMPEAITAAAYVKDGNTATQEFDDNLLQGCSVATAVSSLATSENSIYVLYNNEFVKTTSGNIPAFRCYLNVFTGAQARLSIFVNDDDEITTTGIDDVKAGKSSMNDNGWFDLNGRRLSVKPVKAGLYIHDGHKVVLK